MEDEVKTPTSEVAVEEIHPDEKKDEKPSDPLKIELERVRGKERTELEKAVFSLKKTADRVKELGGKPEEIFGVPNGKIETTSEDDAPVTVGMLKKLELERAEKSAIQLAAGIQDESERELIIHHLKNTIRSTGNPEEDFRLAYSIVNSVKNAQMAEEIARRTSPKTHSSGSGAPARKDEDAALTQEELLFMTPPFSLTKEQIIAARKAKQ